MAPTPISWLLVPLLAVAPARSDESATTARPALVISLHRPERQLEAVLHWFAGARHSSPAAALAALRVQTGRPEVLGKGAQAAIAALNPEMVRELRALDGAVAHLGPADGGPLRWWLRVPKDDGTLAAFASALALGDGVRLPPSEFLPEPVDRLGLGGAPLLLQRGRMVVIGSEPSALLAALEAERGEPAEEDDGVHFELATDGLRSAQPTALAIVHDALTGLGIVRVTGRSQLDDEGWKLECRSSLRRVPETALALDPGASLAELTGDLPADVALAAGVSLDRGGRTLAGLFAIVEHSLRGAGRLSGEANLRSRVNLAANARGFFPELELWPRVDGLGGWLATRDGQPTAALVILHARDATTAVALAGRLRVVLRRAIAADLGAAAPTPPSAVSERNGFADEGQTVGTIRGRAVRLWVQAGSVRVAWGEPRSADSDDRPNGSDPRVAGPFDPEASRVFLIWPGRLVGSAALEPAVARALATAPPLVWTGRREGTVLVDTLRWRPLGPTVRCLVDTLPPLAPPP